VSPAGQAQIQRHRWVGLGRVNESPSGLRSIPQKKACAWNDESCISLRMGINKQRSLKRQREGGRKGGLASGVVKKRGGRRFYRALALLRWSKKRRVVRRSLRQ